MTSVTLHGVTDTLSTDSEKYADVLKSGESAFNEAYAILNAPDYKTKEGWKKEAQDGVITIHSKPFKFGKLFALTGELPCNVNAIVNDNWHGIEQLPEWNSSVDLARVVVKLSDLCDIVHYGSAPVLIISARDYLIARMYRVVDGAHYIVARSVTLSEVPATKDRVRGNLNLGVGCFRPHPTKHDVTLIDYALSIDFKGWLPGKVIEAAMGKILLMDHEENRKHAEELNKHQKN
ncbi:Protein STRL-1 b [Aphelenchoides avenae]|nr:Protein STRL-1 b [Aphelenchus avenae]